MKPFGHGPGNNQVIFAIVKKSSLVIFEEIIRKLIYAMVKLTLSAVCGLPTKMTNTIVFSVKYGLKEILFYESRAFELYNNVAIYF